MSFVELRETIAETAETDTTHSVDIEKHLRYVLNLDFAPGLGSTLTRPTVRFHIATFGRKMKVLVPRNPLSHPQSPM